MNSKLYVTYDKLADLYGPLMEFPTFAAAIRAIGHQVSQMPSFKREDFQLIELGQRAEVGSLNEKTHLHLRVYDDFKVYEMTDILPDVVAPQGE